MPKISIIIPCYNQGQYLEESIQSVLNQTFKDFEIIVVNDGSTDPSTIETLNNLDMPKTRVIHTTNQRLAMARNNGIIEAKGKYILPLDCDDKIGARYLELANEILDNNSEIGIVYCRAEYFGSKQGEWILPPYNFPKILIVNQIFCSALFRKSDWENVGGYNPNMVHAFEDWDFWLSLISLGVKVHQIDEILFYYRQHGNSESMINSLRTSKFVDMKNQIISNHKRLYNENFEFFRQNLDAFLEYKFGAKR